ncbi:hypothetical protein F4823DRAFT_462085 [Ustulina deusta]|nr:hypothetical protein F4823DRAFT_462085 [Ustulina deusta]
MARILLTTFMSHANAMISDSGALKTAIAAVLVLDGLRDCPSQKIIRNSRIKKLGDHSEAEEDIVPRNVNSDEEDIISSLDITILINTEYDKCI